jgi:mRNA interferase MazF
MPRTFTRRGEVWLINLDLTVGGEIRKTRPAVIVSEDAIGILPLRVVVPLTEWKARYAIAPWLVHIEPDGKTTWTSLRPRGFPLDLAPGGLTAPRRTS